MKQKLTFAAYTVAVAILAFGLGYLIFYPRGREAQEKAAPGEERPVPAKVAAPKHLAKVAIIIDDIGGDMQALDGVLALGAPVAVAVLPRLRHSEDSARRAQKAGREVLLHIPMQPKGESMRGVGPGALVEGMDEGSVKRTVADDLATVPGAVGVNNHMGSEVTADRRMMDALMGEIRAHGLYFIDSKTSADSVAYGTAVKEGVRAGARKVFLDASDDPADIRRQMGRLVSLAKRDGSAIAIGHPKPGTLKILREDLPGLKAQGVEVVKVSALLRHGA